MALRMQVDNPAQESPEKEPSVSLDGTVDWIKFPKPGSKPPENGFAVLVVRTGDGRQHDVKGTLHNPAIGIEVHCEGVWGEYRGKPQLQADHIEVKTQASDQGLEAYLASGALPGIGAKLASEIVKHFGAKFWDVLENEPDRLREIDLIGPKKYKRILESYRQHKGVHEVKTFLRGIGLGVALSNKVYKELGGPKGADVASEIRDNPYALTEVEGIGFKKADTAAIALGIKRDSPERLRAGIAFAVESAASDRGHTAMTRKGVLDDAAKLLEVSDREKLTAALDALAEDDSGLVSVELDGTAHYCLPKHYYSEKRIAQELGRIAGGGPALMDRIDEGVLTPYGLHPAQEGGVRMALTNKVSILTGAPGTGKTTILRAILDLARHGDASVSLCAPTGRAANRMEASTGHEAKTVHRLLRWDPGESSFLHDSKNPLETDFVIMDESSMADAWLSSRLLAAVPNTASVLLVGDSDQLPSVGPGNVLGDLIASGSVPVTRLTKVFRQGPGSGIAVGASYIIKGHPPMWTDDLRLVRVDPDMGEHPSQDAVVASVLENIEQYGRDSVQVLSPTRKNDCGTDALNQRLQQVLNPPSPEKDEIQVPDRTLRLGDRVLQTRNNYDLVVFNGDIGRIIAIDRKERRVTVDFHRNTVTVDGESLKELDLAYAITVHKSQGGQFPCVVMLQINAHAFMNTRNLLYTGVSRASQRCVLVGQNRAVRMALRKQDDLRRSTTLVHHLTGAVRPHRRQGELGFAPQPPVGGARTRAPRPVAPARTVPQQPRDWPEDDALKF